MNNIEKKEFIELQNLLDACFNSLLDILYSGISEEAIAKRISEFLKSHEIYNHWYPIMVSAGENTSKQFSRRIHLPDKTALKNEDIVIIDATPLNQSLEIWGNLCKTFTIGDNEFFQGLNEDVYRITKLLYDKASFDANTIGDIWDYFNSLINDTDLQLVGNNIGHSIFKVQKGKIVSETPFSDRIFIDEAHRNVKLNGIFAIEPQLVRKNKTDGNNYGAKHQFTYLA